MIVFLYNTLIGIKFYKWYNLVYSFSSLHFSSQLQTENKPQVSLIVHTSTNMVLGLEDVGHLN